MLAQVVYGAKDGGPHEISGELKPVLRRAEPRDLEQRAYWSAQEGPAIAFVRPKPANSA